MEKKINLFFSEKISLLILILISLIVIISSNLIYVYEEELSLMDASGYILLAKDPTQYLYVQHQDALRILPSILVFLLKHTGLSIENCFKYLTYFFFAYLHIKTFYLVKSYKIENYLALSFIAILFYSNHAMIYIVFNYYQLVDLLTYILILYFIQLHQNFNLKKLFFLSLLAIFTKEYLLILVFGVHIKYFLQYKKNNIIKSLIIILLIFLFHYKFASYHNVNVQTKESLVYLIGNYIKDYPLYFKSIIDCLFLEKNIFLLMPFSLLFFFNKFIKFLFEYWSIVLFAAVPIFFTIFMFHLVGTNFFRIFYQGYFIIIILGLLFIFQNNRLSTNTKLLIFISPGFFVIDFIYIYLNIYQDGFIRFFQYARYENISGYYLFNMTIILLILFNIKNFLVKK